mmetsp:Transcript_35825/g.86421  ORF Transcript_35825/g.86421 Transcript_35825/m.86421 type:complete len:602 (+) Transcript_35825:49-1854(+)
MDHPKTVNLLEASKFAYDGPHDVNILDSVTDVLYERSSTLEDFVECLAKEPRRLAKGVEWYDLEYGLDNDSKASKGLVTRRGSRDLLKALFLEASKASEENLPTMSFIVGSPGIGKTRTLTSALRELLKQDNVNVQYFSQKASEIKLFLRRKGKTYAYEGTTVHKTATSTFFGNKLESKKIGTFILIDPSEDGAKFAHPNLAHMIVSCSPNDKHYHNIHKEKSHRMYYMGLPSAKEIEVMATRLAPDLNKATLHRRMSDVGPVPRYVFSDANYESRKKIITEKAGPVNQDIDGELVLNALTGGAVVSEKPTLCGALFAHVNVERTDSDGNTVVDYSQQRVTLLSHHAAWLLYKRFRSHLVQATITGEECDVPTVFENICAFDLITGGTFKIVAMGDRNKTKTRQVLPAQSVIRVKKSRSNTETRKEFVQPALMGRKEITADFEASETYGPPSRKKRKIGPSLIVLSDGYAAIDFLNLDRQVFQATIGNDHDMKGWVNLLLDAQILTQKKSGRLEIAKEAKPLEFYWVVPSHQSGWETKQPKIPRKSNIPLKFAKEKGVIDDAVTRFVRQFVIFIEKEQPQHSEFWSTFDLFHGGGKSCLVM